MGCENRDRGVTVSENTEVLCWTEEIRRTLAEFCHRTDAGDYEGWVALFTDDGAFHLFGQTYSGHGELRKFIESDQPPNRRGLHLTSDSVIQIDNGVARVTSNFLFVRSGDGGGVLVAGGRYHDVLVPSSERWLFRERECELFGPPATQGSEIRGRGQASKVPWWAVTKATPVELREPRPTPRVQQ
jgi:3-phenylpropionate/cinnamic acid dioxygenase small subunit